MHQSQTEKDQKEDARQNAEAGADIRSPSKVTTAENAYAKTTALHEGTSKAMIDVHLCCNDDHGNPSGKLCAVALYDDDLLVQLECEDTDGADFNAALFPGRRRWVGNMLWDAIEMEDEVALGFARDLVAQGFQVTECADEKPWNTLDGPQKP